MAGRISLWRQRIMNFFKNSAVSREMTHETSLPLSSDQLKVIYAGLKEERLLQQPKITHQNHSINQKQTRITTEQFEKLIKSSQEDIQKVLNDSQKTTDCKNAFSLQSALRIKKYFRPLNDKQPL